MAANPAPMKPTLGYLLALRREMESTYQQDDLQIDVLRQVRTMTRPILLDDAARLIDAEVHDATIAEELQRVVATLSLNPAKSKVTPARPGDSGEANASLREKWSEGVLTEAGHGPQGDTFPLAVDAACGDGGAWTKLLFTKDTWEERYKLKAKSQSKEDLAAFDTATEDAKKGAGVPFVWRNVDVRTCYPLWGDGKLMGMLEVTKRPKNDVFRRYRLADGPGGSIVPALEPSDLGPPIGSPNANDGTVQQSGSIQWVVFYEYWDATYATYAVENYMGDSVNPQAGAPLGGSALITQFKHGYGRVPYFFAPGYTFSWQQGRKVGWGIGQTKRYLCELKSYLQTLHANVAIRDFLMPVGRELPDGAAPLVGEDGSPAVSQKYDKASLIPMRPGEKWVALPVPSISPALLQQIEMVDKEIQSSLTPRVQAQIGSGLEGAGFAINQVLAEAKIQQGPIAQHVSAMLKEVTLFLWWLVRNKVQETVYVQGGGTGGWLGAGPDDLTPTVGLQWELDPDRPSAKLIEERYWHERMQNKTIGRHQAILAMGDNPDEVDDDIELDEIRALPAYKMMKYQDLFQRLERGDAWKAAAALAVSTGALPGMPGAGGMGGQEGPGDMGALASAPNGAGMLPTGPEPVGAGSLGAAAPNPQQQPGVLGG